MLLPQLELELVNAIGLAAVEFSLFLYDEDACIKRVLAMHRKKLPQYWKEQQEELDMDYYS